MSFGIQGKEIIEAIIVRLIEIRKLIKEVRYFRIDSDMILSAVVPNQKGVHFAVEFVVKDPRQLRNSKNIEFFVIKNNNVEIRSVLI